MTDIPSGKVPVVECAVTSWRFFLENWLRFLPAAAIVGVISGVAPALLVSGAQGAQAAFSDLTGFSVTAIAGVFFIAAVLRKAVRDEFHGPTGLSFGADETRLIGVLAAMGLLFIPPLFLFFILCAVILFGRIASTPEQLETLAADQAALERAFLEALSTPAGMVMQIVGLIFLIVLLVVSARLVMVNAATIGERKMVFFQTWSWSKGNVLRIIAATILTALPIALVNLILSSILGGAGATQTSLPAAMVINSALSVIAALGSIPSIALGAHLYKGLRPPDFAAK